MNFHDVIRALAGRHSWASDEERGQALAAVDAHEAAAGTAAAPPAGDRNYDHGDDPAPS